jgi:hypothetical protein
MLESRKRSGNHAATRVRVKGMPVLLLGRYYGRNHFPSGHPALLFLQSGHVSRTERIAFRRPSTIRALAHSKACTGSKMPWA